MIRAALLAWAVFLTCIGPKQAHGDTVDSALRALCGDRGEAIAPAVRAQAHRFLIHPLVLGELVAAESGCRADAVNPITGATGLGQVIPGKSAAPGLSQAELLDPDTNLEATARHLARCWLLCGALGPAIAVYGGHKKCRSTRRSRYVLGLWESTLQGWMRERRS